MIIIRKQSRRISASTSGEEEKPDGYGDEKVDDIVDERWKKNCWIVGFAT